MIINKNKKNSRRFCLGDVHGAYLALKDALNTANFDYENDLLIFLGDVADGWSQTKECIDELMKIKNLIHCLGNHDEWAMMYYDGTMKPPIVKFLSVGEFQSWYNQGGAKTIDSLGDFDNQDPKYLEFFKNAKLAHFIDDEDGLKAFAHASIPNQSFDLMKTLESGNTEQFIWDRWLITNAAKNMNSETTSDDRFVEIYLGHTPVNYLMDNTNFLPQKMTNVWAMDTAASYNGKVTLMDIDSKEVYQSDFVFKYYPDEMGRNKISYNQYLKNGGTPM